MSGNACILRGRIRRRLTAIARFTRHSLPGLRSARTATEAVQLVPTTDRAAVGAMLTMKDHIDIIIPRGGKSLIARVAEESKIPVLKHLDGICRVYAWTKALGSGHRRADLPITRRHSALFDLQHDGNAGTLRTEREAGRSLRIGAIFPPGRGNARVRRVKGNSRPAGVSRVVVLPGRGLSHQYLAPIVSIRIGRDRRGHGTYIAHYGSQHTESIVTRDAARTEAFPARSRFSLP